MRDETRKTLEAVKALEDAGAKVEKREDAQGVTRSGWWLDGVFLAPASIDAANLMKGN